MLKETNLTIYDCNTLLFSILEKEEEPPVESFCFGFFFFVLSWSLKLSDYASYTYWVLLNEAIFDNHLKLVVATQPKEEYRHTQKNLVMDSYAYLAVF